MTYLNNFTNICFFTLLITLLFVTCKGPETIVVKENPTPAAPDSIAQSDITDTESTAAFRQINIGEINAIPTLDPLFASNTSTMRTLQLIYEGLVRYDVQGSVIPGIAKNWTVSPDSLTYEFHLRSDVYYHDSNAFDTGVGRKLVARDVKNAFERMARVTVPDNAARLFMQIKGFQPYYQEQHLVLNPAERHLEGVAGISSPNDSTVVFTLVQKDAHFLQKLTTPYALIYPREAIVENDPSKFKAVGAGPFSLSRQRGDSLFILSKFKNYYAGNQPEVNRVDVSIKKDEDMLFKAFTQGDIHLIPELGLSMMQNVLNKEGDLSSAYTDRYTLAKASGQTYYALNYNSAPDLSKQKLWALSALVDSAIMFPDIPARLIRIQSSKKAGDGSGFSSGDTLTIAKAPDSFSRQFINILAEKINRQGAVLQMSSMSVPTRNTGLFISYHTPLYPGDTWENGEHTLVTFSVFQRGLYLSEIKNLSFNEFLWWLDLRSTTLPSIDNL